MADKEKEQKATENTVTFVLGDSYYEDETVYPPYKETEAIKVIFPTEETQEEHTEDLPEETKLPSVKAKKNFDIKDISVKAADAVYAVGEETVSVFKWIIRKTGPFFLVPFAVFFALVSSLFKKLKEALSKKPAKLKEQLSQSLGENPKAVSYFKAFVSYMFKGKKLLKGALNLAFPILAVLLVMNVYGDFKNTVFALEVIYNGKSIGYVEDESVFTEGKNQALTLLTSGTVQDSSEPPVSEPVYKVRRVAVNELSNSVMVSEQIIASSDRAYTRACGIYIDGVFLCAVKNESDALTVFESILEPYVKKAESSESVAFVEEIEYVQGLYPEDSNLIWSSSELKSTLSEPKSEAQYHKAKKGETVKAIAKRYGLTVAQLKALNPNKNFGKAKNLGKLLISRQENYVRVKVMKTRTRTETIPFETVKQNSSSLAKGTSKTYRQGENGKKTITELMTYIDGKVSYTTVVSEKVTKSPVSKVILVGTKTYTASSSGFTWPTRGAYSISSRYGYRSASISGWSFHGGLDIVRSGGGTSGTPVVAAASGVVEYAYSGYTGYGHTVVINHGNGIKTRYAHMYPGSICVRAGQNVSIGQQIGRIGSTGNSTGPHLHFEVIVNGRKVDPLRYIR